MTRCDKTINWVGEFKVGDFIIDTVSNQFFRVVEVDGPMLLVEQRFWVNSLYQRHATPEEIAAGHRIDIEVGELTKQDRKERKLPTVKITLPPEREGLEILSTVDIPLTTTIINK